MADTDLQDGAVKIDIPKVELPEDINQEEGGPQGGEEGEVTLTPTEQKAALEGWKPLDQWEGDPDEWRDAKTYLDRGELLRKISQSNKEQKEMRKVLQAMQEHNRKLAEATERNKLQDLKAQKVEALEQQDHARVVELDEAISEAKDRFAAISAEGTRREVEQSKGQPPQEFVDWVDRNSWYANDVLMRGAADALGMSYAQEHPEKKPAEVLKYVENEIKRKFGVASDRTAREDRPAAVVSPSNRGASATKTKASDTALLNSMSEQERSIMNTLVKGGHITREKYIEDYRKINKMGVA